MTEPLPYTQPCGCPIGEGHRCVPPFASTDSACWPAESQPCKMNETSTKAARAVRQHRYLGPNPYREGLDVIIPAHARAGDRIEVV